MVLDGSTAKAIEFIDETEFGTFPTDPIMLGFGGYVAPASLKTTVNTEKVPYLKASDSTDRLQSTDTFKTYEDFEMTFDMKPTNWSILPYVLCGETASTYAIGDTIYDISVGMTMGTEYQTFSGGVFSKYECTIEKDALATSNVTAKFANRSAILSTDYIGIGDHCADPTGTPLGFDGVTSVLYDASAITTMDAYIDSIKFGIEYDIIAIKDIGNTTKSNVAAWGLGQRNISLDLNMTFDALDVFADFVDGAAHTFTMTALSKTFTFSNIKWEGDWDTKLDPDDVLGITLSASNVDLAIA